jgi:EAL domain-containing protein (putative c-di-GMP-specific phosphodiesterase class I)
MINTSNKRTVAQNEVLFRQGEIGDRAYLIESGRVLIYLEKEGIQVPLAILGEGEVFGEMALIDYQERSANAQAVSPTTVIIVTKEQLLDRITTADPVVRLLMRVLMKRLRAQNERLTGKPMLIDRIEALGLEKNQAIEQIHLENDLYAAMMNDEFIPFFQPIYDLKTREIVGCEALTRWVSTKGIISPAIFMDVLENSWIIRPIGQLLIEKCLKSLSSMVSRFNHNPDFFVSINISGKQFDDEKFLDHLEQSRRHLKLSAHQIKLEVTERVMTSGPLALATMQNCRDAGYRLAIDDFGTGFSSLQYLATMPLNDLKIDRSFVMKMLTDTRSLGIVKSLVYLAQMLDLKLIAEGIETKQEMDKLTELGVEMGQGYLLSKPVTLEEFMQIPVAPTGVNGKRLKVASNR